MEPFKREDLSFAGRDKDGRFQNWIVSHGPTDYWNDRVRDGEARFDEIAKLAMNNEYEAYNAIQCALSERSWQGGWGEEAGFSERLARFAILGLMAAREEGWAFDPHRAKVASLEAEIQRLMDSEKTLKRAA